MHLIVSDCQILGNNLKMYLMKNSNFGCELLLFYYYASEGNINCIIMLDNCTVGSTDIRNYC